MQYNSFKKSTNDENNFIIPTNFSQLTKNEPTTDTRQNIDKEISRKPLDASNFNINTNGLYNFLDIKSDMIKEYKDQEYFRALTLSKRALDIMPNNIEALYYTALCFYHTKKYHQAEENFKKIYSIKETTDNEKSLPNLKKLYIICMLKQEKYQDAEKLIKTNKIQDEQILNIYGYILEKTNRIKDATKVYKSILEKNPDNINACNSIAYCFYRLNVNIDKGLQLIKKALKKEPDNVHYLDTYAMLLLKKNEKSMAYKVFQKAIQKDPDHPIIQEHKRLIIRECTPQ